MDVIPSTFSNRAAKGEGWGGANVDLGDRYSRKGDDNVSGRMVWFGRNLSAFDRLIAGLGRMGSYAHISIWRVFCLYKN